MTGAFAGEIVVGRLLGGNGETDMKERGEGEREDHSGRMSSEHE